MAGWTTPVTRSSGYVVAAADWNAVQNNLTAMNGFKAKAADEFVTSSTTLQNDDDLFYAIPAVGTYVFDFYLFGTSLANAAGDIKLAFSFPTGTFNAFGVGQDSGLATGSVGTIQSGGFLGMTSGTTALVYGLSLAVTGMVVHATFTATATGTVQLLWAQNSSSASASALKAGSYMTVRQVA